jgi:ribosomal protein L21E
MSRRRIRSAAYRARRKLRHATRHYVIDEPMSGSGTENDPFVGSRITEYRRGQVVSVDIDPGTQP